MQFYVATVAIKAIKPESVNHVVVYVMILAIKRQLARSTQIHWLLKANVNIAIQSYI